MKTKNLFLTIALLFIATLNYAQTSAEASGIAIQGIARDANNTARIDAAITLTVELYYINASNQPVTIAGPEDKNLTTDNFGVFSFVLEPGAANNATIANQQAYLKISEDGTTISDEKLNHVPYAIAANNGVPTGSIMPWVGSENAVPTGWVLCNNQSLTSVVGSANLIALVGNNAPDLRGRFLKGAGTDVEANVEPILVGDTQNQSTKTLNHKHGNGTLKASLNQSTTGNEYVPTATVGGSSTPWGGLQYITGTTPLVLNIPATLLDTSVSNSNLSHDHNTSGETGNPTTGDTSEVRPSTYGVHYIIKL
ncbi:tail fiber protein [Lacinutrix himadriensis]|uniref:tail fiber protein n=1 Tax=Lacinutrix himadriensis TaxID=641549 RepID=UPI0006E2CD7A|nr:tail fiber protein [Lacinutrix himadriensis]